MISFIKKLLRIKHKKTALTAALTKNSLQKSIIITRDKHCISKNNISVNGLKVLNRLHQQRFEACLVGGGVRDLLLGIEPKDFDVATNAHPHEISRLFRNSMIIGQRFRIVHVQFNREIIEVTTFRAGEERSINRLKDKSGMILQDNVFGNISQDAWRRDFTVNALYYNIADASVIDFTGGYQDLQDKIIRLIGDPDTRYKEDPVRMLRAIRFSAKLNFTLEPKTAEPIGRLAHLIQNIPSSRLSEEIFKVYHSGAAQKAHHLLCQYGLFPLFFPSVETPEHPLILQALENTDHRIEQHKPIMPAFLIAALLWRPLQKETQIFKDNGDAPLLALEKAMSFIIHTQNQAVAIPKRHWQSVREIWLLQYRFARRLGPRPFRLLRHPRFRAAYDFLLIRAIAGEESVELADWWTTFQEVDDIEQEKMVKVIEAKVAASIARKKKK